MPTLTYPHWRDVPANTWRWPNFSAAEIACRGTGAIKINTEAMDKLQALRDRLGKPLIMRSAYRSPEHNRAVGGAPASKHMQGTAFDIAMANHDPVAFEAAARAVGFLGFGYYPRSGFMHIDLGPARSWDVPFPVRPVPFAPEQPPAREVLSESRTLRGGGAAGAATVGAAGVEVLQDVLAETQSSIQPLVPYLDTLRWVLIAIALIGIAGTIHARLDDWKRGQRRSAGSSPMARRERRWACSSPPQRSCCSCSTCVAPVKALGAPPNALTPERETMPSIARCSMLPLAALPIVMLWLSACATAGSDTRAPCPPVVEYTAADQAQAADEVETLPEGAVIVRILSDYAVLRDQSRACR